MILMGQMGQINPAHSNHPNQKRLSSMKSRNRFLNLPKAIDSHRFIHRCECLPFSVNKSADSADSGAKSFLVSLSPDLFLISVPVWGSVQPDAAVVGLLDEKRNGTAI